MLTETTGIGVAFFFMALTLLLFVMLKGPRRRSFPPAAAAAPYPSVTLIRPIKGLDCEAALNIEQAFLTDYPGPCELLFVFDDEREPAVPLVRRALQRHEAERAGLTARLLFCGAPPAGRTGKLNAMIVALTQATGELIAFADSDIRPDALALRRLVDTLRSRPQAGSAFAPVFVASRPKSFGDVGYALLLNGLYAPNAARVAAAGDGRLPFIMGQFMIFTRAALEAIGGLESASGQLVDDMYLGQRLNAAGYLNLVAQGPVPIIQQGISRRAFWQVYVRWIAFSRTGLTDLFFKALPTAQGAIFWLGLLLAVVSLAAGLWIASLLYFASSLAAVVCLARLHVDQGGHPFSLWQHLQAMGVLLLAPFVVLRVLLYHEVEWRGQRYRLAKDSRLACAQTRKEALLHPTLEHR